MHFWKTNLGCMRVWCVFVYVWMLACICTLKRITVLGVLIQRSHMQHWPTNWTILDFFPCPHLNWLHAILTVGKRSREAHNSKDLRFCRWDSLWKHLIQHISETFSGLTGSILIRSGYWNVLLKCFVVWIAEKWRTMPYQLPLSCFYVRSQMKWFLSK